jgi:CopG family nickel-responsive transcriptional regulator
MYTVINLEPAMPVVSLSLPESMLKDMDELEKSFGFTGRSELVRAAVRSMLNENKERSGLSGEANGLLVVTHDQEQEEPVTQLKHRFEDIIRTHVHSKTSSSICVELFLVHGPAKKVVEMSKAFQAEDKMKSAKLIPI